MRPITTKQERAEWLAHNQNRACLRHRWSTRGYGSSIIYDRAGNRIARATGCGYDRRGAAFGEAALALFPAEITRLAKLRARGRGRFKQCPSIPGLTYDRERNRALFDGACGFSCVERLLEAVGFRLVHVGDTGNAGQSGDEFYRLESI